MFEYVVVQVVGAVLAAAEQPAGGQATSSAPTNQFTSMLILFVPMILVMWLFMFRPNQKREQERQTMLAGIAKGDKVIMSSGIIGNIVGVTEKTVVLRVSEEPPVKMEFLRSSVSRVMPRDEKA